MSKSKKAKKAKKTKKPKSVTKTKNAEKVTVCCGVLEEGDLFPVKIALNKTVRHLLEVIVRKKEKSDREEYNVGAFALYLAKDENGAWLKVDDKIEGILKSDTSAKYVKMMNLAPLAIYFGSAFMPREIVLHVMIEHHNHFDVSEDKGYQEFVDPYRSVAEMLKNADEVNQLVNMIEAIFNNRLQTFIVLQSSSGMGKTQMAFNLMASGAVDVFYLVCTSKNDEASQQPVYKAFHHRSAAFRRCLKLDQPHVGDGEICDILAQSGMYTFAFVWAMVTEVQGFPGTKTRLDVLHALRKHPKRCVFFLDEFPLLDKEDTSKSRLRLRMIRNMFRVLNLVVIVRRIKRRETWPRLVWYY